MINDSLLKKLWLVESVRLIELHYGSLDDREANRRARHTVAPFQQKLIVRAELLAQENGLLQAQERWIHGAKLASLLMAFVAILSGTGLAFAALGEGQYPVNIFWSLGTLLGIHLLTFLFWFITLCLPGYRLPLPGRVWLWLTEKSVRNDSALQLAPALFTLLSRNHLTRWGLGRLLHGFWFLLLSSACLMLVLLLSTKHYQFIWETTLLSSHTFIQWVNGLGYLPAWFGFPVPDMNTIVASGNRVLDAEVARHSWAGWLLGLVIIYGILPRLLMWLLCQMQWQHKKKALTLNTELAEFQLLQQKLAPDSESLGIVDQDSSQQDPLTKFRQDLTYQGKMIVAIDLDEHTPWPPSLSGDILDGGILNDRQQRNHFLDLIHHQPAQRLLIVCDPRRTPDRGTLRLIKAMQEKAKNSAIWLLSFPDTSTDRLGLWQSALEQLNLQSVDLSWLES